MYDLFVGEIW